MERVCIRISVLLSRIVVISCFVMKGRQKDTQKKKGKNGRRRGGTTSSKDVDEEKISKVYYDMSHSASFGGKRWLKQLFPRRTVDQWASKQMAYSLHKPLKRRFPTRSYRVAGVNDLWQMDLLEMIPYHSINDGYKYVLICIDVFSRFVRAAPLKSKTGKELANVLSDMLKQAVPSRIQTDFGKEFYNKDVKQVLKKYNVGLYTVDSQFKASIVERFNRTFREKMNRYFTYTGKKVWYKILPALVDTYNRSPHRGIYNWAPIDITPQNEFEIWLLKEEEEERKKKQIHRKQKFEVGDYVRISQISITNPFYKNFDQNWSDEAFRVVEVDQRTRPMMYVLASLDGGEIIEGKFYAEELQYIGKTAPELYRIEKVIRTRGKGDKTEYFVKWHGYSEKYNSWIAASQLKQV